MQLSQTFSLLKETFSAWSADRAPRMGAALAYYVSFSIAPLLIIVIAVAGAIFGEQAAKGEIFEQLESTVAPPRRKVSRRFWRMSVPLAATSS